MPTFSYRALDPQGVIVEGTVDAPNERVLEARLRQVDAELVRCQLDRGLNLGRFKKVRRKELIGFCMHMEQVLRAGLPMIDALSDLRDSVENPRFREVLTNIIGSVESGKNLSQAMRDYPDTFDDVFVSLVSVGEESGELAQVLRKQTEALKWQDELVAKAKAVTIYPAVVGCVVFGVLLFMMLFVVPQMVDFIAEMGQELPLHTRALIGLSNFLAAAWYWALAAPVVFALVLRHQARRRPGVRFFVDRWKLKLWLIGPINKKLILSRFASFLALLYGAGVDVMLSLRISENVAGNAVIKLGLRQISASIEEGQALSAGMRATGLFPPLVIRMVSLGESTGELDAALENVSYFYDRDVHESIERLKALIEPALTVILGAILGWVMLSVLGPIYGTLSELGI